MKNAVEVIKHHKAQKTRVPGSCNEKAMPVIPAKKQNTRKNHGKRGPGRRRLSWLQNLKTWFGII